MCKNIMGSRRMLKKFMVSMRNMTKNCHILVDARSTEVGHMTLLFRRINTSKCKRKMVEMIEMKQKNAEEINTLRQEKE